MPIGTPQGTLDFKSVDKVTFVGASSNTVIDTTTGSLGVGVDVNGPTSNLHVVGHTRLEGDIDMLHTANTASIKLNSNVVTEFPRSRKLIKYPRVALTSASQDGYVVTASSTLSTGTPANVPYTVFDESLASFWHTQYPYYNTSNGSYAPGQTAAGTGTPANGTTLPTNELVSGHQGEWISLELPNKIKLDRLKVVGSTRLASGVTQFPEEVVVAVSDTGLSGSWSVLQTATLTSKNVSNHSVTINITTDTSYYRYFALIVKSINSTATYSATEIAQLELFGIPEYDPEAHGTDVVVKSVPNVPNTDWLEVYYDAKDLTSISGTIADLSGKSVVGTLNGDVSLDTSNNVKSFSFDGSGDYISGTLTNTGDFDFTVSTWVFETNDTTTNTVWMIGSGSSSNNPNPSVALAIDSNGSLDFFVFSGIEIRMSNFRDTFGINKWHHIVCTRIGTNLKFFINGVDQGKPVNNSDTLSIAANSVFNIGARTGNQLGTNPMHGKIANFRLFNRAITSDEVWQLYAYQKEYFGHGDLSMTLKAGRLGIGTLEPRAALDVRGDIYGGCPVYFAASATDYRNAASGGAVIVFDRVEVSRGGGYDSSTGVFTVPLAGIYRFDFYARQHGSTAIYARMQKNGSSQTFGRAYFGAASVMGGSTGVFRLNVGDTIQIRLYNNSAGQITNQYNGFIGQYISSL